MAIVTSFFSNIYIYIDIDIDIPISFYKGIIIETSDIAMQLCARTKFLFSVEIGR